MYRVIFGTMITLAAYALWCYGSFHDGLEGFLVKHRKSKRMVMRKFEYWKIVKWCKTSQWNVKVKTFVDKWRDDKCIFSKRWLRCQKFIILVTGENVIFLWLVKLYYVSLFFVIGDSIPPSNPSFNKSHDIDGMFLLTC